LTVSLLTIIFSKVDWGNFVSALKDVKIGVLSLVLAFAFLNIVISAIKWGVLLQPFSSSISYWYTSKLYFITFFFNNFLPGSIGGDGYRVYKIYKLLGSKSVAFVPVFIERVSGLAVLVLVGGTAAAIDFIANQNKTSLTGVFIGAGLILAITLFFILVQYKDRVVAFSFIAKIKFVANAIDKFLNSILVYRAYPSIIVKAIIVSFIFYFLLIYARVLLFESLDVNISLTGLIVVIMLSSTLAMLPISINGYGVLDLSFVHLITLYGINYDSAVLVMMLHRCILITVSLFGGLLYAFSPDREPINNISTQ